MTSNGSSHCHICNSDDSILVCNSCKKPFCFTHRSSLDNAYCSACIDFQNTRIESRPLVDDEGVSHKGRHLILTGETWMRNRDIIAQMTDIELEAKLTALKQAVKEAEMVLDFRRIALNQVQNEKDDRYSRKVGRRKLIGALDSVHKNKIPGSAEAKIEVAKDALKALKSLGLNKDAVANILIKLAQGAKK